MHGVKNMKESWGLVTLLIVKLRNNSVAVIELNAEAELCKVIPVKDWAPIW